MCFWSIGYRMVFEFRQGEALPHKVQGGAEQMAEKPGEKTSSLRRRALTPLLRGNSLFLLAWTLVLCSVTAYASTARLARASTARPARASAPSAARGAAAGERALASSERLSVFEEVWKTINEKYYDPSFHGVDWKSVRLRYAQLLNNASSDTEFYRLLKQMVGELHDAHTRFHTPLERHERQRDEAVSIGLSIFEVEGQPVVVNVDSDSEAARAGVEPGMILRKINNTPVADHIAKAQSQIGGTSSVRAEKLRLYRRIIDGPPGAPVTLTLERANRPDLTVTLPNKLVSDAPSVTSRRLVSGCGYIRLNVWESPAHKEFKRALEGLRDAPGLIIDLRGNPGGSAEEVLKIASFFFNVRTSFGKFSGRSGKTIDLFTSRGGLVYSGPVAILMNEGSGSGSELFSGVMQEVGRATIVGRQSCGCVLGITKFKHMKGGGELAVSELAYVSSKGRTLEGVGVTPDRVTSLTISDLKLRRDAARDVAEAAIRATVKDPRH